MSIRPIRSEEDYDAALEEIESLFSAKRGTDDFDRLEVLAVLVQDYERTHHPIPPPDMQSAIEYELDKRGFIRPDVDASRGVPVNGEVISSERVDYVGVTGTGQATDAPTLHG